jgi:hypothetical protein
MKPIKEIRRIAERRIAESMLDKIQEDLYAIHDDTVPPEERDQIRLMYYRAQLNVAVRALSPGSQERKMVVEKLKSLKRVEQYGCKEFNTWPDGPII